MASDGWIEFNGVELINIARTAKLAETLGIGTVWITPEQTQWIQDELGGVGYQDITEAPWYDPEYPGSTEFAGFIPLSIPALDDSTLTSTTVEYVTSGGHSGTPRNATLPMVISLVVVASTDRGANFGKRWLDRMLSPNDRNVFCSGSDFRYFQYSGPSAAAIPQVHRRDVRVTRGSSVTRKRIDDCSTMWFLTVTLTANDPFEYSDPVRVISGLGGPAAVAGENKAYNPTLDLGMQGWDTTNHLAFVPSLNSSTPISPANSFRSTRGSDDISDTVAEIILSPGDPSNFGSLFPVTPGESWSFQVDARVSNANRQVTLIPTNFDENGIVSVGTPESYTPDAGAVEMMYADHLVPAGTSYIGLQVIVSALDGDAALGETVDLDNLVLSTGVQQGSIVLTEEGCPQYDYTPIYDPLYPALVAPPLPPNFYPDGWGISDGMTFDRFWARVPPLEPSSLLVVPTITLTSGSVDARMVRVSIWPSDSDISDQCDPLFSVVVTYLPTGPMFIIDGEQQASYVWDGLSDRVRRSDSLVYGPDAEPVEWTSFNDHSNLLITVDLFSDSDGYEGDGDVRVAVDFTFKSD